MKTTRALVLLLIAAACPVPLLQNPAAEAKIIESNKYTLYIPDNLEQNKKYPLVIAFEPAGDAKTQIALWKDLAEKHKLIVAASKEFMNGIDPAGSFSTMVNLIKQDDPACPIDKSRVITSGMSGGGMAAHMFSASHAKLTWAVISNCGTIHPYYYRNGKPFYGRNKLAVFLASRTDSNYGKMKEDKQFLEELGWKTKWIEFEGGHMVAPKESYERAVTWLESQGNGLPKVEK